MAIDVETPNGASDMTPSVDEVEKRIEDLSLACDTQPDSPLQPSLEDASTEFNDQSIPEFWHASHPNKDGVSLAFSSARDFADQHLAGAEIEERNELVDIDDFNNACHTWNAWILAPASHVTLLNGYEREWVLLVQPPKTNDIRFPGLDDIFTVSFTAPFRSSASQNIMQEKLQAERVDNPFETARLPNHKNYAAFHFLPKFDSMLGTPDEVFGSYALAESMDVSDLQKVQKIGPNKMLRVTFKLKHNAIPHQREISAIEAFLALEDKAGESLRTAPLPARAFKPDPEDFPDKDLPTIDRRQISAFKYILDPRVKPEGYMDIFKTLPHMENPSENPAIPESLKIEFERLNSDHKQAYYNMNKIPCGLHFVSGCPGAGKTHWNVLTSVLALSGFKADGKRPKILYLIDMNKPVDDVANRVIKLCSDAKINIRMVRMRGWNREIKNSGIVNNGFRNESEVETDNSDALTKRFLSFAQKDANGKSGKPGNDLKAPSLDQVTWEKFAEDPEQYKDLARLVASVMKVKDRKKKSTLAKIKRKIKDLYVQTLHTVDFVATTPVAASNPDFRKMFDPDLIFMDEAPHARELTSLIPIAMYQPKVWIFTGDYRQTLPFVADMGRRNNDLPFGVMPTFESNIHRMQMQVSAMERIELLGGCVNPLMINHRAHSNLQRLASDMFYESRMTSGVTKADAEPVDSVLHLQKWLCQVGQVEELEEPRLIVHVENGVQGAMGLSTFNAKHEAFAIDRIKELLADTEFRNIKNRNEPGRILVIAPYRAAVLNYMTKFRDFAPVDRQRIDIRTIDSAQGHEADVVILDLVRTSGPGFLNDKHRMNVAITRSQQAEMILMNPGMTSRATGRWSTKTKKATVLSKLWDDAELRNQVVTVEV
ncbi:hypothetical protein BROUX41_003088 [Berkeleyomyces rouxiae]